MIQISKIFKVIGIEEKSVVGRKPNWVKDIDLKVNNELEITVDLSMFYPTGNYIRIMNLENGKSTSIMSKAFANSFAYGNVRIREK